MCGARGAAAIGGGPGRATAGLPDELPRVPVRGVLVAAQTCRRFVPMAGSANPPMHHPCRVALVAPVAIEQVGTGVGEDDALAVREVGVDVSAGSEVLGNPVRHRCSQSLLKVTSGP